MIDDGEWNVFLRGSGAAKDVAPNPLPDVVRASVWPQLAALRHVVAFRELGALLADPACECFVEFDFLK